MLEQRHTWASALFTAGTIAAVVTAVVLYHEDNAMSAVIWVLILVAVACALGAVAVLVPWRSAREWRRRDRERERYHKLRTADRARMDRELAQVGRTGSMCNVHTSTSNHVIHEDLSEPVTLTVHTHTESVEKRAIVPCKEPPRSLHKPERLEIITPYGKRMVVRKSDLGSDAAVIPCKTDPNGLRIADFRRGGFVFVNNESHGETIDVEMYFPDMEDEPDA